MREFFGGWRRKLGVVTLAMACLFAAGWVRSIWTEDRIHIPMKDDDTIVFGSAYGSLIVESWPDQVRFFHIDKSKARYPKWQHQSLGIIASEQFEWRTPEWRWRWNGFGYGHFPLMQTKDAASFLLVPYWSIVIPLTLVSAYLLLSKPRTSAPKAIVEPTAAEGA